MILEHHAGETPSDFPKGIETEKKKKLEKKTATVKYSMRPFLLNL